MKKLTIIITLIFLLAQVNYNKAIEAAKQSEGTDSAIEQAMAPYGFKCAWYEDISLTDKITALFNFKN